MDEIIENMHHYDTFNNIYCIFQFGDVCISGKASFYKTKQIKFHLHRFSQRRGYFTDEEIARADMELRKIVPEDYNITIFR